MIEVKYCLPATIFADDKYVLLELHKIYWFFQCFCTHVPLEMGTTCNLRVSRVKGWGGGGGGREVH